MTAATQMHTVLPGLHATAPVPLPFAPELAIRAFLLRRAAGNLVVYSSPTLADEAGAVAALGGAERQYLGHSHEAASLPAQPVAPLFAHALDAPAITDDGTPLRATFARRHRRDGDFEAIPAPGHTAGATAYLWDSGAHRVLFTGDTVYLDGGRWTAGVLASSDRGQVAASLHQLATLDFDVLAPWLAGVGEAPVAHVEPGEGGRRLEALARAVEAGRATAERGSAAQPPR